MRAHITLLINEHDHPVVTKDVDEDDPTAEPYVAVKLSETISLSGDPKDIFNWIDELHARSLLVR